MPNEKPLKLYTWMCPKADNAVISVIAFSIAGARNAIRQSQPMLLEFVTSKPDDVAIVKSGMIISS